MAIVDEVLSAQLAPERAMRRQFETAENEILTLAFALSFGFLSFVAAVPNALTQASVLGTPLPPILLARAFALLALLPLLLFGISAVQRGLAKVLGGQGTGARARRGVVWAFMVASPWVLVSGLVSEISPQSVRVILGSIALGVFLVNWVVSIILNERQS